MIDPISLLKETKQKMDAAIEHVKKEFAGLRTGRASPSMLETIQVDVYGSLTPISQVGTINVPEPRMLSVQVWDKGVVKFVEKAIRESNLGFNPVADGQIVRIPVPALNEERRKDMVKTLSKYAEDGRISIRNVRRFALDSFKELEKKKLISEDDLKKQEKEIQKITDDYIRQIDSLFAQKEKDIMQV
jgi:ribosome recycling factor